jgi:hypothetical protein
MACIYGLRTPSTIGARGLGRRPEDRSRVARCSHAVWEQRTFSVFGARVFQRGEPLVHGL